MEKSNQQPKTEGCSAEGAPIDLWYYRSERLSRSVLREKREPQAGPASGLSDSASKVLAASGECVKQPEPNTNPAVKGEAGAGLPGSKSVARAQGSTRNEGRPESPCRTNCAGQAGRQAQRQEAPAGISGVGLVHSIQPQGASSDAGEGANRSTQPAQETSPVRMTEQDWPTSLRAIAEKACATSECLARRNSYSGRRMRERVDSEEPGAGKPPAGICAGGAGQPASLPRPRFVYAP